MILIPISHLSIVLNVLSSSLSNEPFVLLESVHDKELNCYINSPLYCCVVRETNTALTFPYYIFLIDVIGIEVIGDSKRLYISRVVDNVFFSYDGIHIRGVFNSYLVEAAFENKLRLSELTRHNDYSASLWHLRFLSTRQLFLSLITLLTSTYDVKESPQLNEHIKSLYKTKDDLLSELRVMIESYFQAGK